MDNDVVDSVDVVDVVDSVAVDDSVAVGDVVGLVTLESSQALVKEEDKERSTSRSTTVVVVVVFVVIVHMAFNPFRKYKVEDYFAGGSRCDVNMSVCGEVQMPCCG